MIKVEQTAKTLDEGIINLMAGAKKDYERWSTQNGQKEFIRLPVDIWRKNPNTFSKLIPLSAPLDYVELDSQWETGDVDRSNNRFPRAIEDEQYDVQFSEDPPKNPMQRAKDKTDTDSE